MMSEPITLDVQIACVKREIAMRERMYPRWIAEHRARWTQQKADAEIGAMRAVLETLNAIAAGEMPL